jgi:hypothetical protein
MKRRDCLRHSTAGVFAAYAGAHALAGTGEAGYRGLYSIEAEAEGDVYANVQHVPAEVLKFL